MVSPIGGGTQVAAELPRGLAEWRPRRQSGCSWPTALTVTKQDARMTVIDRTKTAGRYFPIEVDSGHRSAMLAGVWAAGQVIVPDVGLALRRMATLVAPVLLLLMLIRHDHTAGRLSAARSSLPLLSILLLVASGTTALGLVVDLSFFNVHAIRRQQAALCSELSGRTGPPPAHTG
jgi:hypothetical protein